MKNTLHLLGLCMVTVMFFTATVGYSQHKQVNSRADSLISKFVNEVNADSVGSYIQFLEDKGTRFMMSPNRIEVAESIKEKFIKLGADAARIDSFLCFTNIKYGNIIYDTFTWQYNIVATLVGETDANQCMVIGAHYDDFASPPAEPLDLAPGADDNASGVSALFECLRIFSNNDYRPITDIEFVAFAAEELMHYGNSGAQAYVNSANTAGRHIDLMINNDMIAYTKSDYWEITLSNYKGSEWLTATTTNITEEYTTMEPVVYPLSDQASADCKYFYEAGVACMYFMENDFNPFYHTVDDLLENASKEYCAEAIKASIGTLVAIQEGISTGYEDQTVQEILLFPNPSQGIIRVKGQNIAEHTNTVRISDLSGKEITKGILTSDEQMFNLSMFPDGMYIFQIQTDEYVISKKFILKKN